MYFNQISFSKKLLLVTGFFPLMTICWDILTKVSTSRPQSLGRSERGSRHSPDVWWVSAQHPPPTLSPLRAPLCLLLAGSLDRERHSAGGERRLNMVWGGMWENSRVLWYIRQPACQPSTRPSRPLRRWTRGAFVPPSAGYTLPCSCTPILPFSPSCCASSASLFSLTGTCPRIAQQVPPGNRAGNVARVKLSLFYQLSLFFLTEYLLFQNVISW